ncbi:MAG: type II toxin-antitoxin system PemK/MazF family toxin [Clostridia bacterium]|nr:type II toxin-antitoxin system PemK/MazF family toxin [Clostridia bacterium]
MKKGEIYYANLLPSIGSEQQGTRPVLIIQNDVGNEHSNTVIVAMITGKEKKPLPTHVLINNIECRLPENSVVMLEQIQTLDKQRLGTFIGHVPAYIMKKIDEAALCSLGITSVAPVFFRNEIHKRIFQKQMSKLQGKPSNLYIAATYLLCADKKLWDYARYTVGAQSIDFNQLEHISLSPHGYTLFRIAQDIYTGTTHIKINELCNRYIVTDDILKLIKTAVHIGRGGTIK